MADLAPLILFVYNRPEHTKKTISGLMQNRLAAETELYIFSDGPKTPSDEAKVNEVRQIVQAVTGFKKTELITGEKNKGLANSVISGVSTVFEKHDKVIVVEDDLESTSDFLDFMNQALGRYENEQNVFSVTGYAYPFKAVGSLAESAYFSYRGSSWSWATWKDRWQSIDWEIKDKNDFIPDENLRKVFNKGGADLSPMLIKQINGEVDSWAIRFAYNASKQNKLHAVASRAKINNIGQDNSGTHSKKTSKYDVVLQEEKEFVFPDTVEINPEIQRDLEDFFRKSAVKKLLSRIRGLIKG